MEIAEAHARVIASTPVGVLVALTYRITASDEVQVRFEVLKIRNGLVYDMQDHRDERGARKALR
jgi:hypothetical protein